MVRCAITPGELTLAVDARDRSLAEAKLVARCHELAADGVEFLLVREKGLPAGELLELVRAMRAAVQASAMRVLVAQRVDVAMVAGAAGVHLSSADGELTPAQVRMVMPGAFVSVSCHMLTEVGAAAAAGADAILFAPVFGKWLGGVRVADGTGLEVLRAAVVAAGTIPVYALGGIIAQNAEICRDFGASGVAGIRLFFP